MAQSNVPALAHLSSLPAMATFPQGGMRGNKANATEKDDSGPHDMTPSKADPKRKRKQVSKRESVSSEAAAEAKAGSAEDSRLNERRPSETGSALPSFQALPTPSVLVHPKKKDKTRISSREDSKDSEATIGHDEAHPEAAAAAAADEGATVDTTNAAASEEDLHLSDRSEAEVEDGAKYKGQWRGKQRHGVGLLTKPDGRIYDGNFVDGRADGEGKFISTNGTFEGQWVSDQAHGHGKYEHIDGSKYIGEWQHDKKSGKGVEEWVDGSQYKGEFLNGYKHGSGIYISSSGTSYEGQFAHDKMDGHGGYKFPDGRAHIGQFRNGHMNGSGTMEWPNGCKYSGSYKNDMKHGEGTFKWVDGRAYHGQWQCGKQHGNGVLVKKDGQEVRAVWKDGKMEPGSSKAMEKGQQSATEKVSQKDDSDDGSSEEDKSKAPADGHARANADLALLMGRKANPAGSTDARRASDLLLLRGANQGVASTSGGEAATATPAPCFTPEGSESEGEPDSQASSPQAAQSPVNTAKGLASIPAIHQTLAQKIQGSLKVESPTRSKPAKPKAKATGAMSSESIDLEIVLEPGEAADAASLPSGPSAPSSPIGVTSEHSKVVGAIKNVTFPPGKLHIILADGGVVDQVALGSIAFCEGVRPGWVVLNVAGQSVEGAERGVVEAAFAEAKLPGGSYVVTFRQMKDMGQSSSSSSSAPAPAKAKAAAGPKSLIDMMQFAVEETIEDPSADRAATPKHASTKSDGAADNAAAQVATPEVAPQVRHATAAGADHIPARKAPRDIRQVPITGREVQQWVYQLNIDPEVLQMAHDEAPAPSRGCFARRRAVSSKDDKAFEHDKDFVLFLSRAEADLAEAPQWRMLHTLHASLTQSVACPATGKHWKALGFESEDPQIDLNATGGVLNLVHLFMVLSNHVELLRMMYWKSISENVGLVHAADRPGKFPLAAVSMRITQMVVEVLVLGKLSRICKLSEHGVFEITCQLHAACLYTFCTECGQRESVVHTYAYVRTLLHKKPAKLLKDFEQARQEPSHHTLTALQQLQEQLQKPEDGPSSRSETVSEMVTTPSRPAPLPPPSNTHATNGSSSAARSCRLPEKGPR